MRLSISLLSNNVDRLIAVFEATKGALVLMAGFGLLALLHKDVQLVVTTLISHLHLNPTKHYPHVFLELASHVTDPQLWLFANLALVYAGLRLFEAYGLWFNLRWAQWIAVLSGGFYMPLEIYELFTKFAWLKVVVFLVNVCVVLYMYYRVKRQS